MNEVTVRFRSKNKPFDPAFFEHLSAVAEEHEVIMDEQGRDSMKDIREQEKHVQWESLIDKMDALAYRNGPQKTDSVDLIREDRDR